MKWVNCELYKTLTKQHIIDKLSAYGVSLRFFHCAFVSLNQFYCDISFSSISKTNSADIYCSLKRNGAVSRPSHGCGTVGRRVSPLHFEPLGRGIHGLELTGIACLSLPLPFSSVHQSCLSLPLHFSSVHQSCCYFLDSLKFRGTGQSHPNQKHF